MVGGGPQFFVPNDLTSIAVGADPDWQLKQQQVAIGDAFKGGVPTDAAGNTDFNAMAKALFQRGALGPATSLIGVGQQQQALRALSSDPLLGGGGNTQQPQQPASGAGPVASTTTSKYDPQVVSYITSAAKARGINPNVALQVFGGESRLNPGASGDPDSAGNNTSFGIPQLHYGNSGGGSNSVAGMGDDFTKATGLDARDPKNWKATVDYALDRAAKGGWGPWHAAKKLGIADMAGIGPAPAPTQSPQSNDASQPDGGDSSPSGNHPYAPSQPAPVKVAGPGAPTGGSPPSSQGGGVSPAAPAPLSAIDPTLNGLLPPTYAGNPGKYITDLRGLGARYGAAGVKAAQDAYNKQADLVERALERSETPEVKNYAVALRQGYTGTMMQFAADKAAQIKSAEIAASSSPAALRAEGQKAEATARGSEEGKTPYELVPMQPTPGGPTVMVPKSQVLASNTPMASQQPKVFAQRQDALGKQISSIPEMMHARQVTRERIDAMGNLLETFQSGAGADQKAAAIAAVRSAGINIPDSATANPAAVEQFWKNAQANVFSQIKDQGGKVLVSEIQGFQKANANPNMQPESNAAILAQQKGLLNWQDARDQALSDWYRQNPYAYDDSQFAAQWEKANKPADYVAAARKEIAPRGIAIPAPTQRVVGQRYSVPGKGVFRWLGNGWSAN